MNAVRDAGKKKAVPRCSNTRTANDPKPLGKEAITMMTQTTGTAQRIPDQRDESDRLSELVRPVIADLLEQHGLTAESCADQIGVNRVTLARELAGVVQFSATDLLLICMLCRIKPSTIMGAAEAGELCPPEFGPGSIPRTTWAVPGWLNDEPDFDRGCMYAERTATYDGVTVTLHQTDELEYDPETRTYSAVRQPAKIAIPGGFEGTELELDEARAMVTGPTDDPIVLGIVDLLAAYDAAANQ